MNGNGVVLAEQIKWWHAGDMLTCHDVLKGLEEARACQHPDAQWVASLFPPGEAVTHARVLEVMREHGDDPRAMLIAWQISWESEVPDHVLERAARAGYAVAQGRLARHARGFDWAHRAAAQKDRLVSAIWALLISKLRFRAGPSERHGADQRGGRLGVPQGSISAWEARVH
jgi:hypothetical protein